VAQGILVQAASCGVEVEPEDLTGNNTFIVTVTYRAFGNQSEEEAAETVQSRIEAYFDDNDDEYDFRIISRIK
jgi:hypothetical protein